jgi:serine/threonine-protein kinase
VTSTVARARPLIAGRYRLEEPIGEGGMAQVWRAMDQRLDRPVALKLLTLTAEDETQERAVQRFLREARLAAAVRHPNVVDVLDFGTTDEGRPFMVLELLEGESLEARLSREPALTLAELVELMIAVLDGLEAVHRAGIVHRDVKPDNVFLVADGDRARPKLLDFGVSRADGEEGRRSVLTTIEGRLVGTPEYMSPEQARGRRDVDLRTDVYSVGVMLYEAITGKLPYQADGLGDLIIAIAMGGAPPVVLLQPDVGEPLSDVIACAMALKRDERFPSARAMRDALISAAEASFGSTARASLPARPIERHGERVGSAVQTLAEGVARASGRTPSDAALQVPPVGTLPPRPVTSRARRYRAWSAVAAIVVTAGAVWAFVGMSNDAEAPETSVAAIARPPRPSDRDPMAPHVGATLSAPSTPSEAQAPAPLVEAPERPAPIRVRLRGVPSGAHVLLDGAVVELIDDVLEVPRDGEAHRIVVRAGARTWSVRHVGDADTEHRVRLASPRTRGGESPGHGAGVFRDLDY